MRVTGFGKESAKVILYIDKRPELGFCKDLSDLECLQASQLDLIKATGNHWRKILNIFAKIAFAMNAQKCETWQAYRDDKLLTKQGDEALIFQNSLVDSEAIHLICGKSFFHEFDLEENEFRALDEAGEISFKGRVYRVPYLDYRQFPNSLIEMLVESMKGTRRTGNCKIFGLAN